MNLMKTSCFLSVDRDLEVVLNSVEQLKNEGFDAVEPISIPALYSLILFSSDFRFFVYLQLTPVASQNVKVSTLLKRIASISLHLAILAGLSASPGRRSARRSIRV